MLASLLLVRSRLASVLDSGRRRLLIHRRGLAALLTALAAGLSFQAASRPPPPADPVLTARTDLPGGAVLRAGDLRRTAYARGTRPAHAVTDPGNLVGRRLALPLGRGDPVTSSHLLGDDLLRGLPGRSAVAVRLPDAGVAGLLHEGDRVDLLATDPRTTSRTIAREVVVLAVPEEKNGSLRDQGRLVLLAVEPDDAGPVAVAANSGFVTVVWSSSG